MPDFDIDFCQDRRDEVIRYVQKKYGADRVAQIITHGKLQARAVLRDVGRVLQMPYGQVDKLCKLVPNNPANPVTLPQAIEGEPKLQEARDSEPMVARLLEIAQKLEGLYRHASTHAAGMVIGDRPLDELVPLYRDPKSSFPITQFNWKLVEAAGLVKFDFLGLKTLTVLQKAVELIKRGRGIDIDLAKLPLDDKQELRAAGAGRHGRRVPARRHGHARKPQAAQARPLRGHHRHGGALPPRPDGQHPDLHQPQARRGAGRLPASHAGADPEGDLRRHHLPGAGDADRPGDGGLLARRSRPAAPRHGQERQDARWRSRRRASSRAPCRTASRRPTPSTSSSWSTSSPATASTRATPPPMRVVSYHTAYLKANYREEFLAASMTLDMGNTDKLAMFASEAKKSGIAILPPCINASEVDFLVRRQDHPLLAGGAEEHRRAGGREPGRRAQRQRALQGPLRLRRPLQPQGAQQARAGDAGCRRRLRCARAQPRPGARQRRSDAGVRQPAWRPTRRRAPATCSAAAAKRGRRWTCARSRPGRRWSGCSTSSTPSASSCRAIRSMPTPACWPSSAPSPSPSWRRARTAASSPAALAGVVVSARERRSQKGNKFAFAMFSEPTGQFEAVIFSETLAPEPAAARARHGRADLGRGRARRRHPQAARAGHRVLECGRRGRAEGPQGRAGPARPSSASKAPLDELKALLKPGGKGTVCLSMALDDTGRELEIALPGRFDVSPVQKGALTTVPGVLEVIDV